MRESVRQLAPDLFHSAGELLAHAFFDNPAHAYICPDPRARMGQLTWLLGGNLHAQPDLGASFCMVRESRVVAMGFWTQPDSEPAGLLLKIRAGLLKAPFRLGPGGFRRLLEVSAAVDRHRDDALDGRPCWYLNNMAVRDDLRGKGIGSDLLREQISAVRERDPGRSLALATQRPENVVFYGRLGFVTVSEERVGRGGASFRNWIMECAPAV